MLNTVFFLRLGCSLFFVCQYVEVCIEHSALNSLTIASVLRTHGKFNSYKFHSPLRRHSSRVDLLAPTLF